MNALTKENTWNAIEQASPKAYADFMEWLDAYKKKVDWDRLFNPRYKLNVTEISIVPTPSGAAHAMGGNYVATKYHDLPFELQIGILLFYIASRLPEDAGEFEEMYQETLGGVQETFRQINNKLMDAMAKEITDKF